MISSIRTQPRKLPLVILHIGTEKTGTTTVQEFVHKNRKVLANQKLGTLKSFGRTNNRDFVAYFQKNSDDWGKHKMISREGEKSQYFSDFQSRFEKEIAIRKVVNSGWGVLITSEHFSSRLRTFEELNSIKTFLEKYFESIKIICYFRPQEEMAISLHSTALKGQGYESLENRLKQVVPENYYYNFHQIAKMWASVFGEENLHFRIFDREQLAKQDIRHDFIEAIKTLGLEVDSSRLDFSQRPANESLNTLEGSAFSAINETVPYWNLSPLRGVNRENQRLKKAIRNIPSLRVGQYRPENPGEVQSRFAESNKKFFDEFLPGQGFEMKKSKDTIDSIPLEQVERIVQDLTRTILSEKVNSHGPALLDSDAEYLRDIAISILDKRALSEKDAAKLLELALRIRPEGPVIKKQLDKAKNKMAERKEPRFS